MLIFQKCIQNINTCAGSLLDLLIEPPEAIYLNKDNTKQQISKPQMLAITCHAASHWVHINMSQERWSMIIKPDMGHVNNRVGTKSNYFRCKMLHNSLSSINFHDIHTISFFICNYYKYRFERPYLQIRRLIKENQNEDHKGKSKCLVGKFELRSSNNK